MVTSARNWKEENPDVLDFSQVTGCELDIEEDSDEEMREDKDGNSVSYNPPRFTYDYDFNVVITVRHPYFDDISFRLNSSDVSIDNVVGGRFGAMRGFDPSNNAEYRH